MESRNTDGLSFTELTVTAAIAGVLFHIAAPSITDLIKKAHFPQAEIDVSAYLRDTEAGTPDRGNWKYFTAQTEEFTHIDAQHDQYDLYVSGIKNEDKRLICKSRWPIVLSAENLEKLECPKDSPLQLADPR